jgi:hypothetical protein
MVAPLLKYNAIGCSRLHSSSMETVERILAAMPIVQRIFSGVSNTRVYCVPSREPQVATLSRKTVSRRDFALGFTFIGMASGAPAAHADGEGLTAEAETVKEAVARALQDPDPEVR